MITKLGGRKFVLSLLGVVAITALSLIRADATAYGSIALIVTAYAGANGYIEGRYATKPTPDARDADAP